MVLPAASNPVYSNLADPSLTAQHMARAIQLARQGWYTTRTNPRVGCVLVRDGVRVGEGAHLKSGEAHAEVHALNQAGERAKGADAYVTLEPCSHQGRTPPCADALIKAGIKRVFIAQLDANPLVAGRGVKKLQAAGIEVIQGLLEADAKALNLGFMQRMLTGMPRVTAKLAMSIDGRTAMASGESQWITGPEARADVQKLRAASCAIITGVDSVLMDNSRLTVRDVELTSLYGFQQPLRVVTDSCLRIALTKTIVQQQDLQQAGQTVIATSQAAVTANPKKVQALQALGVELLIVPLDGRYLDLTQLLKKLAEKGCNEVMLEAGANLCGAFIQAGLVQSLHLYMAPLLLGDAAKGLLHLSGLTQLAAAPKLDICDLRAVGKDWRFILELR
ncbi:MAG TPA: bifunctional diaminohydroxyphosphoribosylaminopyrimidine deaminase/5-amino-6-(5-phosphoribosylamino)uracil reductase RibD [Marinospirillum sp.]|uniref:bifunctional diaminohydroxyphosphoribosylaminopyrimidine deaminase/5-amino-6-(5-phosphoribosylamino)uracil reductase RibD n=1 Tax=Marinospirillum sp. TaxID=2183934 RepID=UPI002B4A4FA8|nr:bifunctional diaminohydroxyphosphoribosylaminopyrimidine deaminase/5-amino-6-(5-phosphoribosylamino)uracil reductase RibD [Marinospirillum sp.]HKM15860.1 bifunctional diaminohydroxyphosphoribosylaminopyrimidine deaminase/5-amino-6-(5-phosphoribosylamino)uracil reductase RibD [Marinospirillum sp.]